MKIGVISDTHGDATGWQRVMETQFHDVDLIIHAGDILYHGPRNPLVEGYNPPELASLINSCPVPVLFARGNCDADVDQLMLNYPVQTPYVFLQVGNLRIMAHHGDGFDWEEMLRLSRLYGAKLFISGHTHIPVLEHAGEVILLNPGSPSLPKGEGRPTVAVLDYGEKSAQNFLGIKIIHIDDGTYENQLGIGWKTIRLLPKK